MGIAEVPLELSVFCLRYCHYLLPVRSIPARKHIHALELLTACKRKNEDCATLCGKRVTTMPFSICYGEREIEDSRRYY